METPGPSLGINFLFCKVGLMASGPSLPLRVNASTLPISTPSPCYLTRFLLTGGKSEPEEFSSVSSASCRLVGRAMLTRAWWSSLALPTLMLSYNTAKSRTTNTERAIPVKGKLSCRDLARQALLPCRQLPLEPGTGARTPLPIPSVQLPLTSSSPPLG